METEARSSSSMKIFLFLNCILLVIGSCGGQLITRLYFINGGHRIWLFTFLQTAGFPIILIPIAVAYFRRQCHSPDVKLFSMEPRIFQASAAIGVLVGGSNFLSTYGLPRLPGSTVSLIAATQLSFAVMFNFLVVKKNLTAYSVNSVVLLTVAAMVLGLQTRTNWLVRESATEYAIGSCLMVGGTVLSGFVLPLVEMMYRKAKQTVTYTLVMKIHVTICASASAICMVGMLINGDFQAISKEAKQYELGEFKYYLVLVCTCIVNQCSFLGCIGVIFYVSALLSGIIVTLCFPITQLMAVAFFHDKWQPVQGFALFLSLWGFSSYLYGQKKMERNGAQVHEESRISDLEMAQLPDPSHS